MPEEKGNIEGNQDVNNDNNDVNSGDRTPDYITQADFESALANARKEEKDKLYADKKKQDSEIRKLKEINNNMMTEMKTYNEFMSKFKSVVLGEESEDSEVNPSDLMDKMDAYRQRMQELEKQQKKTTDLLAELHSKNKKAEIEAMRRNLIESTIKEGKLKFIPDIVTGDTPDEVMESISNSAELYKTHYGSIAEENSKLKKMLEDQRNLTDAVTASHVPGAVQGPADSVMATKDLIQEYASKILNEEISADDVPTEFWRQHGYAIQQVATQIAEQKLAEASKKTIPPRSAGIHRTTVGYKRFEKG
jgi:hypothetical protein